MSNVKQFVANAVAYVKANPVKVAVVAAVVVVVVVVLAVGGVPSAVNPQ